MNDAQPAAAPPAQPSAAAPRPRRSPALSNMVRELRRAPGTPSPDASGPELHAGASPGTRSEPDTDRFDLSRLAARHGVPAHAIGAWARRACGARLLDQIAEYEHQRSRLLLGACVARAVQLLLSLASGEGGTEESLSGETRRKACVDLLKLGHELSMVPRPKDEGSAVTLAGSSRSDTASRPRSVEPHRAADPEEDAAFQERARRLLEDLGAEPSLQSTGSDAPTQLGLPLTPQPAPDNQDLPEPSLDQPGSVRADALAWEAGCQASAAD